MKTVVKVEVKDGVVSLNIAKGDVVAGWSVEIAGLKVQQENVKHSGKDSRWRLLTAKWSSGTLMQRASKYVWYRYQDGRIEKID